MTLKTLPRAGSQQEDRRLRDSFRNRRVSRQVINGHHLSFRHLMSTTVLKTLQMCFKPVWNNSSVPRGILLKQSMTTSVFVLNEGGGGTAVNMQAS